MPGLFHPLGPTLSDLVDQGLSSLEQGYDKLAPRFDYTPFRTPDELVAAVVAEIGDVPAVLDLCCGTGAGMEGLKPHCERLVGVDLSAGMLAEAERRVRIAPGRAKTELIRANVLEYTFNGDFDAATCFGAFGHLRSREQPAFAAQVYDALRPGGRFVFLSADRPSRRSAAWWKARTFNAVMTTRNFAKRPPFVMYYLNFLIPRATEVLQAAGFEVEVRRNALPEPWARFAIVTATRPRR